MQDIDTSSDTANRAVDPIIQVGAAQLAHRIASGDVSSVEVVESFVARIQEVDSKLNAVVIPLFHSALEHARKADEAVRRGEPLGPLHGVPITIKECFHVEGTDSTIGLSKRVGVHDKKDGLLVQRLKTAGAIPIGKTNLPQLMLCHENDNPVYGRTNNPWNQDRGPGGSSGGEAAIIAAGGSPLGLASDIGGSIRQPCHSCGIHGIKPTSGRLSRRGFTSGQQGMEAVLIQPGPMARRVEDLTLGLRVMSTPVDGRRDPLESQTAIGDPADVDVSALRIAAWTDDGFFPASPSIKRAVREAAETLSSLGAKVESFIPPDIEEAVELYLSLMSADGGASLKRCLRGSKVDWRISRLLQTAMPPRLVRPALIRTLRLLGQGETARLVAATFTRSVDEYWQLIHRRNEYTQGFLQALDEENFDAMLFPPHALPALPHDSAVYLINAGSYCFLANLLGIPSGVVSTSRVLSDEQESRPPSRDFVNKLAIKADKQSEGLPVGVQVAARHWREDIVLAIMAKLESAFPIKPFPI